MNIPGFTAGASLFKTSECYSSLSRNQGALGTSLLPSIQMALLPGGAAPAVYGTKCGPCSSSGWQSCTKTIDGKSYGTQFQRKCVPGGGGTGSGGSNKTQECALDYYACVLGCQIVPWPGNLFCVAKCSYDRIKCDNPF
jgi:hypothetical protein